MRSKPRHVLRMAAVGLFIVCVSCAAFAAPAPCSLLSEAEVSAVLGMNPGPGKPVGTKGCDWIPAGQPIGINAKKVTLMVMDAQMYSYAVMPMNGKATAKKDESGIGDQAVFGAAGKIGTMVVKKGKSAFVLHVYGFPIDQIEAKEKTLASAIVSKL